jgi:predicted N-acetyltransferase YhbS
MAIAALCIGGMVVARSVHDQGLGSRLREAAIRVALELGGWDTVTASKRRTRAKVRRAKAS